jgi:hypothetical protein
MPSAWSFNKRYEWQTSAAGSPQHASANRSSSAASLAQDVDGVEIAVTETVDVWHACEATEQDLLYRFVQKPDTVEVCRQLRLQTDELAARLAVNACMQPRERQQALRYDARILSCARQTISPLRDRIRYPSVRRPRLRPRPPEPGAPSLLLLRGSPPCGTPCRITVTVYELRTVTVYLIIEGRDRCETRSRILSPSL